MSFSAESHSMAALYTPTFLLSFPGMEEGRAEGGKARPVPCTRGKLPTNKHSHMAAAAHLATGYMLQLRHIRVQTRAEHGPYEVHVARILVLHIPHVHGSHATPPTPRLP